jgi:hypothetical protein
MEPSGRNGWQPITPPGRRVSDRLQEGARLRRNLVWIGEILRWLTDEEVMVGR